MAAPDRTPERVIEEAQKLLGIGENPPGSNCNALTHRFGMGCVAWCDIGWWTALFNAGFQNNGRIDMPGVQADSALGDAYVPSTMRHFQAAGRFSKTPVPGAGEIHFWGGGEANSHIAMYVKDYGDGTHLNIECNHNNACEYVRRSNSDSTIQGYCIPAYVSTPAPPSSQEEENMTTFIYTGQLHGVFVDASGVIRHRWADKGGAWRSEVRSSGNVPGATVGVDSSFAGQLHFLTPRPDGTMQHDWYDGKNWGSEVVK